MTEFTTHFPDLLLLNDGGCQDIFFHGDPFFPDFSDQTTIPSSIFLDSSSDHKLILQMIKQDEMMSNPASSCGDSNEIIKIKASGSNSCSRKGKRTRNYEKESDVVHVRARRGQATDKHSLAERVRRGKINEKFKYLQDIVPGCYKTMGMSMMLDETINYVQSLQSQVEFLSMKLTAASTYYDFNSEPDFVEVPHARYS